MDKIWLRIGVSALALITAQHAQAQDFYAGFGYESGSGEFDGNDVDTSAGSFLAGYRYNLANNVFLGGELETSVISDYSYSSAGDESMERLSRLRVLAGYNFGQFAVFGALGGTRATGDFLGAATTSSMSGLTFGLGGEFAATDRVSLRLEAIHDNLSGNIDTESYDWDNTSVRAAAIFKF